MISDEAAGMARPHLASSRHIFERIVAAHHQAAQRARALARQRAGVDAFELEDWLAAEAELLPPLEVEVERSEVGPVLRARVGEVSSDRIDIAIEPRCAVVIIRRPGSGSRSPQAVHIHELGQPVEPRRTRIRRVGDTLEVALRHADGDRSPA